MEKKRKEKEKKVKRKGCWGNEVSGGSRGVAAAVGAHILTNGRFVSRCSCDGRVRVYWQ